MARVRDVPVHDSTRVRDVRVAAEQAAARGGLDGDRAAAAALVATELATNLLKHAGGGQILLDTVDTPAAGGGAGPTMVQIVAVDHGPGMPDVVAALRDGYSTTASLGAGLGTCRRLCDDFELHSAPEGTVALARIGPARPRSAGRPAPPPLRVGGVNVPYAGAEHSGDAWAWAHAGDRMTLMLADGLGHGEEAAHASTRAVEELRRSAALPPEEVLRRLDTALRRTRGAAVAVAQLDLAAGRLRFAGLGNVGARLRRGDTWQPLLSHPGIVGAHRPATLHRQEADWDDDCLLILHSDGLPSRWSPGPAANRGGIDPAVLAAVILRDASSSARPVRDDTCVAVLSPTPPDPAS